MIIIASIRNLLQGASSSWAAHWIWLNNWTIRSCTLQDVAKNNLSFIIYECSSFIFVFHYFPKDVKDLRSLSILNIFKIVLPFSPERKAKCCTPSMSRKFWQECIYCSAHLFNSLCCCWVERLQDFSKKISKYFVQRPGPCHATLKHEQSQETCNFSYCRSQKFNSKIL